MFLNVLSQQGPVLSNIAKISKFHLTKFLPKLQLVFL